MLLRTFQMSRPLEPPCQSKSSRAVDTGRNKFLIYCQASRYLVKGDHSSFKHGRASAHAHEVPAAVLKKRKRFSAGESCGRDFSGGSGFQASCWRGAPCIFARPNFPKARHDQTIFLSISTFADAKLHHPTRPFSTTESNVTAPLNLDLL